MNTVAGKDLAARYLSNANGERRRALITVLHIGAQQTRVMFCECMGELATSADLQIGSVRTSTEHLGCYPPTPAALENAIMVVEDEVARVRTLVAEGSVLISDDASVREIARVAGLDDRQVTELRLEAVEQAFERLVTASLGRPASGLPASASFAGALLILREFMHHLGFASINIVH
ncbi:MAG: hypothetical protein QM739_05795 [Propionivibrio sp.]